MRYLSSASLAFAALTLAACQQPAPSSQAEAPDRAQSAPAMATPKPVPGTATAIPERFRGVWDNAEGSCDPTSDLRLEIGAVSIEFYESLGTVTGVTVESPDSIVVDMAMEGEGERWTRRSRYVLSDDGATLTPSEVDGTVSVPISRKRCAG